MNSEQSLDLQPQDHNDQTAATDQPESPDRAAHLQENAHNYYTRPPKARVTQEAIDDLQEDEVSRYDGANAATSPIKSSVLKHRMRRISKKDKNMLNNSQYGQYLEIPRSKKTIFQSQEQAKQARTEKALIICVVIVVIAICIALRFLM